LGPQLILAAASAPSFGDTVWGWFMVVVYSLMVLVGLGVIIFVHEAGHFAVAKLCGVKCLKFYLGFDIFGAKLWKHRWGETEYGIGALPLGGYVKMLGQEDNPARLREELQRAKARQAEDGGQGPGAGGRGGQNGGQGESGEEEPIDIAAAEQALNDPRSYLCQSVPRRMAIISAGVIMNLIFAFVVAVIAFEIGVEQLPCKVGGVIPGEAAWKADIRVGDRIEMVAGEKIHQFPDLVRLVVLGDVQTGIPVVIQRPGVGKITVRLTTDRVREIPSVGIRVPLIPVLGEKTPVIPGSAADRAVPKFQGGDRIIQIGGVSVRDYAEVARQLALHQDEPLRVTVERAATKAGSGTAAGASPARAQVVITVPPSPQRWLGLVMQMGRVTAVRDGSSAAEKGVSAGDLLRRIGGQDVGDPLTLPDRVYRLSQRLRSVDLVVVRDGKEVAIPGVPLRPSDRLESSISAGSSLALPALGIAYQVSPTIEAVTAGSPAAASPLKAGDVLVHATIKPPPGKLPDNVRQPKKDLKLGGDKHNIPALFDWLQEALPGSSVELTLDNGSKVTLAAADVRGWFYPDRGFNFEPETFVRRGETFAEAIQLGARETEDSLTSVFQFLRKIGRQVPASAMGGPIAIFNLAYGSASEGMGTFLLFLTFISANLAVVNFLPIPVLDGGHMIFLAYEGIRGKPPSEKIQVGLTYAGLLFLVGLMVYVFGLDLHVIPRD
jgi:regulator of sigma E protease